MNEGKNNNDWLSRLFQVSTKQLWVIALLLLLGAILFAHADIQGKSWEYAGKVVQLIKEPTQVNSPDVGLTVAKEFVDVSGKMKISTFFYDLLVHIATAVIVAVLVIHFVETGIRKVNQSELDKFKKDITENVWEAISSKIIPTEVTDQIKGILQSNFVKEDVRYVITLDDLPGQLVESPGEEGKWILLKRELVFVIRNISGNDLEYHFKSQILTAADKCKKIKVPLGNHHGFPEGELQFPRHAMLCINGEEEKIDDPTNFALSRSINLKKGNSHEISHTFFELMRIDDEANYIQVVPLIGLDVTVRNNILQRVLVEELYLSHPERDAFITKPMHGGTKRCVFEGKAILPGQMFSVRWGELKQAEEK